MRRAWAFGVASRVGARAVLLLAASALPALAAGGTVSGKVDADAGEVPGRDRRLPEGGPGRVTPRRRTNLDQKGMKFLPHVLAVAEGDTVKFLNHDTVDHNVYTPRPRGLQPRHVQARARPANTPSTNAGVYTQLCSVHPEMLGYIFVGQNPYAAVVDKTGSSPSRTCRPGTYQLAVWNPHLKARGRRASRWPTGRRAEANFALQR